MKRLMLLGALSLAACGPNVASLDLKPTTKTLTSKGESFVIKADPKTDQGETNQEAMFRLKWSSENPAVADVAQNGLVTAHETGTTNIVVQIGKVESRVLVKVSLPETLEVGSPELEIVGVGESSTVTFSLKDKLGRDVPERRPVWLSSNTEVVTVQNGVLTSVGPGETEVTAKLDKLKATVKVKVRLPEIASVSISPETIDFSADPEAVRLQVAALDARGKGIRGVEPRFRSLDEAIASVSEEGLVRGLKKGKTAIEVTIGGRTVEVPVKVP